MYVLTYSDGNKDYQKSIYASSLQKALQIVEACCDRYVVKSVKEDSKVAINVNTN